MSAESVQRPGREIEGDHPAADVVLHDEVDGEILDEELSIVLQ